MIETVCGGNEELQKIVCKRLHDKIDENNENKIKNIQFDNVIVKTLKDYIQNAPVKSDVNDLIDFMQQLDCGSMQRLTLSAYKRKGRYIMAKRLVKINEKKRSVYKFLHGDNGTTPCMRRPPVKIKNMKDVSHPVRFWKCGRKSRLFQLFLESE